MNKKNFNSTKTYLVNLKKWYIAESCFSLFIITLIAALLSVLLYIYSNDIIMIERIENAGVILPLAAGFWAATTFFSFLKYNSKKKHALGTLTKYTKLNKK